MMKTIELFNERLKLRLIEFSDLSAIQLTFPSETDRYNTLEFLKVLPLQKIITLHFSITAKYYKLYFS
jgi:hypothetical protein